MSSKLYCQVCLTIWERRRRRRASRSFHAAVQEVVSAMLAQVVAHVGHFEIHLTPCGRVGDVLLDQLCAVRVCVAGVSFEALGDLPGG